MHKKILITSPSLNVKDNVSGISSIVRDVISNSKLHFEHFTLGSKDGVKKDVRWVLMMLNIYVRILRTAVFKRFDIVHLNVGLETASIIRDSLILLIVKNIFGKKVILHVHGGYFLMNEPKSKLIVYLMNILFRGADKIIVLSEVEKEILERRYGRLSFHVFPNAVNTVSAGTQQKTVNAEKIKLIFMGRINITKGIFTISDSFQYLEPYFDRLSLDIYGAGPELDAWMAALGKYKGLHFTYKGIVGGADKWNALHQSDVFLLPSLHSEGMPIAMIEAMAAGCIVIVTDVASIKSIISDNVNGILLSESCPKQLAEKIREIVEGKINVNSMTQKAREYVETNLSLSGYIDKLEQLYATL